MLFGGNIVYSIQLGTFNSKESAINGKNNMSQELETEDLFIYKTDRGLWTVRCNIGNDKNEVESVRKASSNKKILNGRVVPTDEDKLKLDNSNYISSLNNKKSQVKNQNSLPSSNLPEEILSQNNQKNSSNLTIDDNLNKIEKIDKQKNVSNSEKKDYFQKKIFELRESYKQIDSYTFRLKVGARVYVIQFTDNPNDEMATRLLNQRPSNTNLNTVSLSNGIVDIVVKLSDIEQSQSEIEKGVIAVLNESRKNPKIRIKAYRIK